MLSDQTCDAETSSGCRHPAPTVPAGSFPIAAATDQRFNTVYVGDANAFQPPYTLSVLDTVGCNADEHSRCNHPARTLPELGIPVSIAADQRTDSVYVATSGPLQVIAAATCNATITFGCRHPASVYTVAVDPSTNTIYTLNNNADGSGYVSVIDGRHCNAANTSGCASQTAASVATVAVGNSPADLAVDAVHHTLYVTNFGDRTVSVIDTSHCLAGDTSECASQTPATIATPAASESQIQVDLSTNEVYVANRDDSSVSVIHAGHCNAADTSGCSQTPKLQVGSNPSDLTLDHANHPAYVPNFYDHDASVFRMFGPSDR